MAEICSKLYPKIKIYGILNKTEGEKVKEEIQLLKLIRKFVVTQLTELNEKDLVHIPEGFGNNILWNAGHILTSQQVLHYSLGNQEIKIPKKYMLLYRKGSSPKDWQKTPSVDELTELLLSTPELLEGDYKKAIFNDFNSYTTSNGISLNNIEESIAFNNFHEGLHLGVMTSIRKLL
ncbi:MAG TPA: DinB family protein [Trueperaceae bacterium]|nr:DinB family protein [Trueperaceae bacterium]